MEHGIRNYAPTCVDCADRIRQLESALQEANYRVQLLDDRYSHVIDLVCRLWSGDGEAALRLFSLYPAASNKVHVHSDQEASYRASLTGYDGSVPETIIQPNEIHYSNELPGVFFRDKNSNDFTLNRSHSNMGISDTTRSGSLRNNTIGSFAYNREKSSSSKVSASTCSSPDLSTRYNNHRTPFGKVPSRVLKKPNAYMSLPVVNLTFPDPAPLNNSALGRRSVFPSGSRLCLQTSLSATQQTLPHQFALPQHRGFEDRLFHDDIHRRDGRISSFEHLDSRMTFDSINPLSGTMPQRTDDSDMMKTLARIDADIREFRRRTD